MVAVASALARGMGVGETYRVTSGSAAMARYGSMSASVNGRSRKRGVSMIMTLRSSRPADRLISAKSPDSCGFR